MNKADSERLGASLEQKGYEPATALEEADLVVLNSCVVRQSAENRVLSQLGSLRKLKKQRPDLAIVLTGCLVDSQTEELRQRFPFVDFFLPPQSWKPLLGEQSGDMPLPSHTPVSSFVPIMQGCNNLCSYCIVPYRRGREKSRLPEEVLCEVTERVRRGAREVTLLGQNVNSYGKDLPQKSDLALLLREVNKVEGLWRIRFLTSHPKDVNEEFIGTLAQLDKVCLHLSLPLQSGDDEILKAMRRGYTVAEYCQLIASLRQTLSGLSLSTDIIVGFPGESEEQFQNTLKVLSDIRFDIVHVAAYSPRPGTQAARLEDSVPEVEKGHRLQVIERLQEGIASEINSALLGKRVEVLVEENKKGKWQGRTRSNKLVFFPHGEHLRGTLVEVEIENTSPWSLQGGRTEILQSAAGGREKR